MIRPSFAQAQSTFTIGVGGVSSANLDTLNPTALTVVDGLTYIPMHAIYDGLVQVGVNASAIPDLAQNWSFRDPNTIIFNLVHNATWHDGQAFTADDVVYTLNLYIAHPEWYAANGIDKVKSVSAIDNYTVQINLVKPDVTLLDYLTGMYILPKHVWQNVGNFSTFANSNPVGTGPFTYVSWGGPGTYYVLAANPNYFYGRPHIDRLVVRGYASYSALILALQSGEVDFAGLLIQPTFVPTLNSQIGIEVISRPDARYFYFSMNEYPNGTENPTLRDRTVRIALSHAMNTTELAQVVWQGYATPQATVVPPVFAGYVNPNIKPYDFNLTEAAQMLDNAGYKVGSDGIRVSPAGVRMSYKIEVPNGFTEEYRAAQLITGWWKQIGVEGKPAIVDEGTLGDEIASWKHDTFIWDWVGDRVDWWVSMFTSDSAQPAPNSGLSDSGYLNPTFDQLFQLQAQQSDPAARMQTFWKMEQILHDDAVYVPLYDTSTIEAFRSDRFTGVPGGLLPPATVYSSNNLFRSITPISMPQASMTATSATATSSGMVSTPGVSGQTLAAALAAVIVVLIIAVVAIRRKASGKPKNS